MEQAVNGDVWVLAEHNGREISTVTLEILGEARKLAEQLGSKVAAVLPQYQASTMSEPLAHYGADKIFLLEHALFQNYSLPVYV